MQKPSIFFMAFLLVAVSITLLAAFSKPPQAEAISVSAVQTEEHPVQIPVGIFVTSIHDIDFRTEQYSVTFWLWSTFPTGKMKEISGGDYVPYNSIEVVNALSKIISPTDRYAIPNEADGTTYAIAKYTAKINQRWDVRDFPFDRQNLRIVIESVGI